jgi:hypothetical protein
LDAGLVFFILTVGWILMRSPLNWCRLLGLVVVLALGGCSSGPPNCNVSGTVNLDGKPLAEGEISFVSDDSTIPAGVGPVSNGSFNFTVKAGKKTVRVYAKRAVPGTNPPMYNEALPGRYNAQSELTADVTPKGENKFTFNLQSR